MNDYVHGYSPREAERLADQANTLKALIHPDTVFAPGSIVLEVGCGTGEQTAILARKCPDTTFVSLDTAAHSLAEARARITREGIGNVTFLRADLFRLPFSEGSFDHVLVCFVLEHLSRPLEALVALRQMLKPGGTIVAIEGDHGSCYFHPETDAAKRAWRCLIEAQRAVHGNALIGRELFPLLSRAGFRDVETSPRMVYADASRPDLMDGFVKKTIIPMVEGVEQQAFEMGLIDRATWAQGIADLHRTGTPPDGTFCYTFFKATGRR